MGRFPDFDFRVFGQGWQKFERGVGDGGQAHPPFAVPEQRGGQAGQGALSDDGADFRLRIVGQQVQREGWQARGNDLAHFALRVLGELGQLAVRQAAGDGGADQVVGVVDQAD